MPSAVAVPLVAQGLVPLALIAIAGSRRHASRLSWLLALLLASLWILAITVAGVWLVLPWWLTAVFTLLLVAAVRRAIAVVSTRALLPAGSAPIVIVVLLGLGAAAAAGTLLAGLRGRRPPVATVDVAPPLRAGTFLVANGGSNALVNAHVNTLADVPRYRPWRGQSLGVDLVKLNGKGLRAGGVLPASPAEYAIFGDTIYAPCAGPVIDAVDGFPDMAVPHPDQEHMAGNHVILECDGVWVLLGHMRRGSVLADIGQLVRAGEPLGQVGNSGNSGEPHLHLHVQKPGTADAPFAAEPIPLTVAGRYLVRGRRLRW